MTQTELIQHLRFIHRIASDSTVEFDQPRDSAGRYILCETRGDGSKLLHPGQIQFQPMGGFTARPVDLPELSPTELRHYDTLKRLVEARKPSKPTRHMHVELVDPRTLPEIFNPEMIERAGNLFGMTQPKAANAVDYLYEELLQEGFSLTVGSKGIDGPRMVIMVEHQSNLFR